MADNNPNDKQPPNPEGGPQGGGRPPNDGNMRFSRSMLGWILILATAILLIVVFRAEKNPETITYTDFQGRMERGLFSKIIVKDDGTTFLLIATPGDSGSS